MKRVTPGLLALVAIACASNASAATLTKTGDLYAPAWSDVYHWSCEQPDGSRLQLVQEPDENSVYGLKLEHRDSSDALLAEPFLIASGDHPAGQLACTPDGTAIVTWRSYASPCSYFRKFSPDSTPIGPIRTATHGGECGIGPVFAFRGDGGYVLAWNENHAGASGDVWTQTFDSEGEASSPAIVISSDPNVWHGPPALGVDEAGNTVVAWFEGGEDRIVAVALDATGALASGPVLVSELHPDLLNSPYAVVSTGIGRFGVEWPAAVYGMHLGQRLQLDGVAEETTTTTTSTTSTTLESSVAPIFGPDRDWGRSEEDGWIYTLLTGDGQKRWLASWYANRGRLASISEDQGRRWTPPFQLEVDAVASDGADGWLGIRQGYRPFGESSERRTIELVRSSDGREWTEAVRVADLSDADPIPCLIWPMASSIARSPAGTLLVAWTVQTECRDELDDVYRYQALVARSDDNGDSWSAPELVQDSEETRYMYEVEAVPVGESGWLLQFDDPKLGLFRSTDDGRHWASTDVPDLGFGVRIACDASGSCVAVSGSADPDQRSDSDILASTSVDAGLTWSDPVTVHRDARADVAEDLWPSVATDGKGLWTVAWTSTRNLGGATGLDQDLLEAVSTDEGSTWSPPRALNRGATGDGWTADQDLQLGYGDGSWVALWGARGLVEGHSWGPTTARVAVADDRRGDGVRDESEECDDGNLVDGDGCDSNGYATGCGNGIVTGDEACDDGNLDDSDACTSTCAPATCGDGHVRSDLYVTEECDDGNSDDTDGCTSFCGLARCGDGVVEAGVEECDDGNANPNDACLSTCKLARCGDGVVEAGVEECDDGNESTGDRCPLDCRMATCGDGHVWIGVERCDPLDPATAEGCPDDCGSGRCGDANDDGNRTTSDALRILRHGLGMPTRCLAERCDVDGNYFINSRDALMALGLSVGKPYPLGCDLGPWITLRLKDASTVGALQVAVDISNAPISIPKVRGGGIACEPLVAETLVAGAVDGSTLRLGVISMSGITGPAAVARCRAEFYDDVDEDQFVVTIDDATDSAGTPIRPLPEVSVRGR